ncbi:hypothetical protein RFI_28255 [Reticulomyxa filosa]|uniref:Uncharacterized protein n=1 Tax=Reticulomyxa filosa TaxID=46433 RepID=X6M6P4_RETFI|nr:hypothetical protein RFI_28255 [Reticulomyxa filosa]|eukprot:ETO09132.1 hypothetical protein RFI_28255 [Reticulomyxa filosa]
MVMIVIILGSVLASIQASTLPKTPDSDDDIQANYIAGTEASKTLPSPHDDADLNASANNIKTEKNSVLDDEHGNDGVQFTIVPPAIVHPTAAAPTIRSPPPTIPHPPTISFPQVHKTPTSDYNTKPETNLPLNTSFNRTSSTTSIKTWTNDKTPPSDEETEVNNSSTRQKSTPDYGNVFNYNVNNNNNAKSADKYYYDANQRRNSSGGPSTVPETMPFSERCSKYGAEQSPFVNSKDSTAKTSHKYNKKKSSNEKKKDSEKSQNDWTKVITKEEISNSDFKQCIVRLVDVVKRERSYSNSQLIKIYKNRRKKRRRSITKFISDCPLGISISFPGKVYIHSDLKDLAQYIHALLLGSANFGILFCNSKQERCAIFLSNKVFFKSEGQFIVPSIAWDNQNKTNDHFERSKKYFIGNCFKEENEIEKLYRTENSDRLCGSAIVWIENIMFVFVLIFKQTNNIIYKPYAFVVFAIEKDNKSIRI